MAVLGFHCFAHVFCSHSEQGLFFIACMGFSYCGAGSRLRASALVAKGLSGCGSQAMESYQTRDQTSFLCISRLLILFSHTPSAGGRFGMSLCIWPFLSLAAWQCVFSIAMWRIIFMVYSYKWIMNF